MTTALIGGGWDEAYSFALYRPFLDAAGANPRLACVIVDEGDGAAQFELWRTVLQRTGPCRPGAALIPLMPGHSPRVRIDRRGR